MYQSRGILAKYPYAHSSATEEGSSKLVVALLGVLLTVLLGVLEVAQNQSMMTSSSTVW